MSAAPHLFALLAVAMTALGVFLLRRAWGRNGGSGAGALTIGWAVLLAAAVPLVLAFGAEVGIPYAALAFSTAGLVAVAANLELREARVRTARAAAPPALDPSLRPRNIWRGTSRTIAALVVATSAAAGRLATLTCLPLTLQTRFGLAATLFPVLWACFVVWVMAEARLLRAALALVAIGALGMLVSLPGVCR
jgi:hypothetical protein